MVLTVRIDEKIHKDLENLTKKLKKTKSAIIREALRSYMHSLEANKQRQIQEAIKRCAKKDYNVYKEFESLMDEDI